VRINCQRLMATAALLLASLLAAGCGFQLQPEAHLPAQMEQTLIVAQAPYSHFVRRLTILLEQNGARVQESPPASAVLEIPVNEMRKDILSIGDTARVREFRVVHRVTFRLVDADGAVLVPEQTIERARVISFSEQDILAATREEEFLREELAETMSRLVLRALGTTGA
jgi:LPS-assembly lipoprotein